VSIKTEDVKALYQELKSIRRVGERLGLAPSTVHYHLSKSNELISPPQPKPKPREKVDVRRDGDQIIVTGKGIKNLKDLIQAANLGPSWVCIKHTLNSWQGLGKDSDIVQLHQVKAYFERAPAFFVEPLQPMREYKRKRTTTKPAKRCALIIPDSQHGFRRIEDVTQPGGYRWEPLHDRAACDVVLQAADLLQPDEIILLGDMVDGAAWSTRWQVTPDLRYTTNATMRELYAALLVPLRLSCPESKIVFMEGNHEKRVQDALTAKLCEGVGLRTADTLNGDALITIETLLALDSLDIEYYGPYGAAYWLYDKIRIQHGTKARPAGETCSAYLRNAISSVIFGHVHRLELAQKKIQTPKGSEVITAMSPGCLCRTDGGVPHAGGDFLDWQQGFGIVYESDGDISIQVVPIDDGSAILHGHKITGDGSKETTMQRTGLPF